MFAEVIIPLALPKNYTWEIPEAFAGNLVPGSRVEVNLGRNKKYAGIVKTILSEKPQHFEVKPIINVLDAEPVVQAWQLKFWEWMASYYMCTEGEVMAASLPAHFKLSSETILSFNNEFGDDFSMLDNDEYLVAEALQVKNELKLSEVQQILDAVHVYPVVNRLIAQKVCYVWESFKETYKPRKETYIQLAPAFSEEDQLSELLNNWGRAPRQMELLLSYLHLQKTEGEVLKGELLKKSGASDAQLKALIDKGILVAEKRQVDRVQYMAKSISTDFELSTAQQDCLHELHQAFEEKQVCLLHGITSSGKTMIYVKLIEEYIRKGMQVLYLLPEIALTSQIIRRLQKYFGGYIGIYHSRFSQNERVEIWNKVKSGELKVVLGARSSLFLPFPDLGFIICDEEHDSSYKQQDPAPRYNGRDAAIFLASLTNAKVLLGTATPSLESYYNAVSGKYGLSELVERFRDIKLPVIEMIDTRQMPRKAGEKLLLSVQLTEAIKSVVEAGKQVILFQNRRGYAPYQVCGVCGWIAQCRHCDVSLTYHKFTNKLKCHYCGTMYPVLHTCQACGSDKLVQRNFGTEKLEEVIDSLMPEIRTARMDFDSVKNKNAHDVLIQQFEQKRIDVLVGTQMVVKGLDFENVELVGIPDADGLLHFADFRVNERAFQLIEQVSGRAGRKDKQGRVMIQTATPNHPLLLHVAKHDYKGMYLEEIEKRKQFFYPPFSRIIDIHFRHKDPNAVKDAAGRFSAALQIPYGKYMVGPAEPVVNRVRNMYLMELLLKLPRDAKLIAKCKQDILKQAILLRQQTGFKNLVIVPDVDPL
jgi:primosomal protein N' (replication factor Y) (superfamily II helicase)